FIEDIEELCKRLQKLLKNTLLIESEMLKSDKSNNQYSIESLLYRISEGYSHTIELRFIWLKKLGEEHKKNKNYTETAQCYIRILTVIFEILKKKNSKIIKSIPVNEIYKIVPFLTNS